MQKSVPFTSRIYPIQTSICITQVRLRSMSGTEIVCTRIFKCNMISETTFVIWIKRPFFVKLEIFVSFAVL